MLALALNKLPLIARGNLEPVYGIRFSGLEQHGEGGVDFTLPPQVFGQLSKATCSFIALSL